jgi:hypothetical protein
MAQYSSGTYTYLVINETTGSCVTCTSSIQPHPIFDRISGSGDTVVQLNAVTIGGFNGLNS